MARRGAKHELDSWLDRNGYQHAHAPKVTTPHPYATSLRMAHATRRDDADNAALDDRLFIGTYPTGIRYADKKRERDGDYLPLAFLPFKELTLEWQPRVSVPLDLRYQIERHAERIRARRGEDFQVSTSGQTVKLGHARIIHQEPTGRPVYAEHERDHHITTAGRRALTASEFALPPGPSEKRRGIKGRLPIDTLKRARNALARAAQMKKSGDLSAGQLAAVRRKVHAAWPSIDVGT